MSDRMRVIPFDRLMEWVFTEFFHDKSIFGVSKFYKKLSGETLNIFNEKLELPFGPAAGPHTQLAQNLIASYVAGSRFFELKTVQTLDGEDLPVSKPCILAADECYNVEWSTELYVRQAMDEYIKGWFALKILSKELRFGDPDGFIFNMSVGYDLDGIKSDKIDSFIEGLKNAENTPVWKECKEWALSHVDFFGNLNKTYIENISPHVCSSITLSTLHGCPPEEIERIAYYLLTEKKLHTFVKCNPTMLGWDYVRQTLTDLGFDYITFGDHHFKADLQFDAAVPMLDRLIKLAGKENLSFGVKLTNTCPVSITENELPGEEMYMSGRSLFPLSMELANRLSKAFDGRLRISYSGGADIHNIEAIYDAGIWPITIATTLLKPGGYERLNQIAKALNRSGVKPFEGVDLEKVQALADDGRSSGAYRKPPGQAPKRKMTSKVPLIDCFTAPCRDGCPIEQDIPAYLRLTGEGKYLEALRVITERNPLPFITGRICSHHCAKKCTRSFYEDSVNIRCVKIEAASSAYAALMNEINSASSSGVKKTKAQNIAIVGGGPAGLAAAYLLAREGHIVTVFEKRSCLGGIVKHVIPEFRISDEDIENDIALIKAMGVDIRLNSEIINLQELRMDGYEKIILATGAWKPGVLIKERDYAIGALEFLEQLKKYPDSVKLGENVAVIGGGNTAMDAARAAKRVPGVRNVSIVYRRTKRYMPADSEEIELALKDGVVFYELLSPLSYRPGVLTCEEMVLCDIDESGRRSSVFTGGSAEVPADFIITAIGDSVDLVFFEKLGIITNRHGVEVNKETMETNLPGIYVIGDAKRGPATVAEAIADAIRAVRAISGLDTEKYAGLNINPDVKPALQKKGILYTDRSSVKEWERCLECATVCECCVDVCPNRANIVVNADNKPQIVHVDYMCNECGNCEEFCPYQSAPYKDKFTLFTCQEDFDNSKNSGFLSLSDDSVRIRLDGMVTEHLDGAGLPDGIWTLIQATLEKRYILLC